MSAAAPVSPHSTTRGGHGGNGHGGNGHGGHGHGEHVETGFLKKYVFSSDHKVIGIQFLFLGLMFMVVGGLLAMLIRWQLAWPDEQTQWKEHPVPILAQTLWAKTGTLGPIAAVDAANKTVTVSNVDPAGIRAGSKATVKTAGGEVEARVA